MGYRHFSPGVLHRLWSVQNAAQRRRYAVLQQDRQRRKEGVPGRIPALPDTKAVETNPAPQPAPNRTPCVIWVDADTDKSA